MWCDGTMLLGPSRLAQPVPRGIADIFRNCVSHQTMTLPRQATMYLLNAAALSCRRNVTLWVVGDRRRVGQWDIIERKWNAIFMPAGKHRDF